jgi:hypothetical protein
MGFKMKGWSAFNLNEEPDWANMNISATGKNEKLSTDKKKLGARDLTPEEEAFKEKYPELYAARTDPNKRSKDFTWKERLQAVQHGMDKAGKYDPTGFSDVIGTTAGVAEGTKNIKDLGKSAVNVVGGKIKTGKKVIDKTRKGVQTLAQINKLRNDA